MAKDYRLDLTQKSETEKSCLLGKIYIEIPGVTDQIGRLTI